MLEEMLLTISKLVAELFPCCLKSHNSHSDNDRICVNSFSCESWHSDKQLHVPCIIAVLLTHICPEKPWFRNNNEIVPCVWYASMAVFLNKWGQCKCN